MRMRLECAHRLLSDARFAALTVSEVAERSGFLEPSHFARRFRKAYEAGPTEFRASRLGLEKSGAPRLGDPPNDDGL